jgi:hypothetical protein
VQVKGRVTGLPRRCGTWCRNKNRRNRLNPTNSSSPCQNSSRMRGVRMASPGYSFRCVRSIPDRKRSVLPSSTQKSAAHCPDQPMANATPPLSVCKLKKGRATVFEDRPPTGARCTVLPGVRSSTIGAKSSLSALLPRARCSFQCVPPVSAVSIPCRFARTGSLACRCCEPARATRWQGNPQTACIRILPASQWRGRCK